MSLEQEKYIIKDDGKHALYCNGYYHLYTTYWGIGCGSFNKRKCSCNILKRYFRRRKFNKEGIII